jgi:hypothetical protein
MIRRLKTLCLVAVASGCTVAAAAHAADQTADKSSMLEKAFGSTIVSTYPDGRQAELWLQRDGAYTAAGRRQDRSSGHWQIKGDKLCLKQQKPVGLPFSYCTEVPAEGLDKPWSGKSPTGDPITIKVVKGMHGRDAQPRKAAEDDKTGKG